MPPMRGRALAVAVMVMLVSSLAARSRLRAMMFSSQHAEGDQQRAGPGQLDPVLEGQPA